MTQSHIACWEVGALPMNCAPCILSALQIIWRIHGGSMTSTQVHRKWLNASYLAACSAAPRAAAQQLQRPSQRGHRGHDRAAREGACGCRWDLETLTCWHGCTICLSPLPAVPRSVKRRVSCLVLILCFRMTTHNHLVPCSAGCRCLLVLALDGCPGAGRIHQLPRLAVGALPRPAAGQDEPPVPL